MSDVKILILVGSLRAGSVNRMAANAGASLAGDGVSVELFDLAEVPLYDGDVEVAGLPASVQALHDAVGEADGVMIFSPEYNGSFPAVTKNAIDWCSRPPKAWEGRALTMVVTTPGPRAGLSFRTHFEAIMAHQPVRLMPTLGIGGYGDKIAEGQVNDPVTLTEIAEHLAAFATFCGAEPDGD